MTQPSQAPGWYPDPSNPDKQIYWDGSAWRGEPSAEAEKNSKGKQTAVAVGVCLLVGIGLLMSMQSVSLMSGSGPLWTGVGFVAAGLAVSFFLGAANWVRVVAVAVLLLALVNVLYVENEMDNRRNEISQLFDN
ncbi:hypothetical protein MCHIJ_29810 [Mycolicibacterium chitae]|uniref:Protein of uncharacterized function (DUF2510) n=1 Tax=Mycolicibacterium chitae TaxID=1792 RepID=A0A448I3Y4_MYCCI|nr:DUF2510 domain-containing protein [Mycolicibacterium chitae]MCV7109326.1 DUF2510 domain-containing protein [Mycolicibacterium chitae]BBZ03544.1 hypothetical protein MCHIJ_29810 [Mycolicibacterium chitae]VEG47186.1 Protein of uncharacterised function (DUF2510) [Mycolicibacterium chitae]